VAVAVVKALDVAAVEAPDVMKVVATVKVAGMMEVAMDVVEIADMVEAVKMVEAEVVEAVGVMKVTLRVV